MGVPNSRGCQIPYDTGPAFNFLATFQNFINICLSFRLIRDTIIMAVDWEQHRTELDRIFFKDFTLTPRWLCISNECIK